MKSAMILVVGLFMAYTPDASAWYWNDVQRWAQEVEDRADNVYEQAMSESRQNYADEEYALELLWNLSTQADHFSDRVDLYPWMDSRHTRNDYHQLYTAYYRAQRALENANFSYHVDSQFQELGWAMDSLRREYVYEYRHDGWAFRYHRDHWYITLGHRHYIHRHRYRNLRSERLRRRALRRDHFERRWRNDRRYDSRARRNRIDRERRNRDRVRPDRPRRDGRRDNGRTDRGRRDRPRTDRPRTDRPRRDRPRTDRPRRDRPRNDRPRTDRGRRDNDRTDRGRRGNGRRDGRRPRRRD